MGSLAGLGWAHWLGSDGILRYSTGLGLSATQLGYSTALLDLVGYRVDWEILRWDTHMGYSTGNKALLKPPLYLSPIIPRK